MGLSRPIIGRAVGIACLLVALYAAVALIAALTGVGIRPISGYPNLPYNSEMIPAWERQLRFGLGSFALPALTIFGVLAWRFLSRTTRATEA